MFLIRKHPHGRKVMTNVVAASPNTLAFDHERNVVRLELHGDSHRFIVETSLEELKRVVAFAEAAKEKHDEPEFSPAPEVEAPVRGYDSPIVDGNVTQAAGSIS